DIRVGEHAAPEVWSVLQQIGASDILSNCENRLSSGVASLWTAQHLHSNDYIYSPWGYGINLARPQFEQNLAFRADDAGVHVLRSTNVLRTATERKWTFEVRSETGRSTLQTKFAVDATGRSAWLLRSLDCKPENLEKAVGLLCYCEPRNELCIEDSRVFIEPALRGWWYSAPLANGQIATVFVTDSDILARSEFKLTDFWSMNLRETRYTRERVRSESSRVNIHVRPAHSQVTRQVSGENWIAVGDAAFAQDPLSGNGILRALQSGLTAANAIHRRLDGDCAALTEYQSAHNRSVTRYWRERTNLYREIAPGLRAFDFWSRRQSLTTPIGGRIVH
ncbi:MAG: NAD(P)/FAD-dependent oxidoreductase, partial [Anderseniella sp.]